jgi:sugar phosphate isomerase/epimerase
MRLGLVTYLWAKDWDLPTIIKNCEKSGVLGVELRSTHAHGVEIDISKKQRKEILSMFNDSNVSFVGPGSAEEYNHPDPARLKKAIEETKKFVQLSHDCGGTGVKVRPNKLYDDIPHEKTIEQIGKSLNEVGKYAQDFNQEIRVEVHGKGTSELPVMKKIFDYVHQKNVGMCWNCNEQDLQGEGFQSNFDLVKNRLATTTHVRELNIGEYPYQKLMDNLVKMNYSGWILLECRTDPKDKVAALIEQKKVFDEMIKKASV